MSRASSIQLTVLIDSLGRGGAQRALVHLVQGLSTRGYQCHIISLSGDNDAMYMAQLQQAGVQVQSIGKKSLLCGYGFIRIIKSIHTTKPRLLFTMLPFADLFGRVLGHLVIGNALPIISSIRATSEGYSTWMNALTAPWAKHITFNSLAALREAQAAHLLTAEQGIYIPNGVNLSPPSAPRALLRTHYKIAADTQIIGTIGRFTAQKDSIGLIRAFARIARAYPDTKLLLAGDGPLRNHLCQEAAQLGLKNRILFPGICPASDILACCDIFAFPSRFEGMPNALMEAMLTGLPVVATPVGGIPELVIHKKTGLLVPVGDIEALATALAFLLDNPDTAKALGCAARQRMQNEFSLEVNTNAYDILFRSCLNPEPD